jgi:Zn-dependent protease with chaperone function
MGFCIAQVIILLLIVRKTISSINPSKSTVKISPKIGSWRVFKGLSPEMFAHEDDMATTKALSQLPLIPTLAKRTLLILEQALTVEQLSSSILVGPNQMPRLYRAVQQASNILDITPPELYVRQSAIPNAFTLAFRGKKPYIIITTGLLDLLTDEEILAVLGHEIGHLKCEHAVWVTLLNILVQFTDAISPILRNRVLNWQRSAEFSSDRAALLVTQNTRVVASVLMKLCGGSSKNEYMKEMNVDSFLEQARQLEREKYSLGGDLFLSTYEKMATHPLPLVRAIELMNWSESAQYSGLLRRSIKNT